MPRRWPASLRRDDGSVLFQAQGYLLLMVIVLVVIEVALAIFQELTIARGADLAREMHAAGAATTAISQELDGLPSFGTLEIQSVSCFATVADALDDDAVATACPVAGLGAYRLEIVGEVVALTPVRELLDLPAADGTRTHRRVVLR